MKPTTLIAYDWAIRSFGSKNVHDLPMRALRLAEEAVELAQAHGISKEKMLALVSIVYDRPHGDPQQELGGVMMTATLLAAAQHYEPEDFFYDELRRVLAKPTEHFEKRNQEKIEQGLIV